MSDRDRGAPAADWVDTTAGSSPDRLGGTGQTRSSGSRRKDVGGGDVEDVDTGTGAAAPFDPDDADRAKSTQPGAGLGESRGAGAGSA